MVVVLGPWLCPGPATAVVSIWEVKQLIEDPSIAPFVSSLKKKKSFFLIVSSCLDLRKNQKREWDSFGLGEAVWSKILLQVRSSG